MRLRVNTLFLDYNNSYELETITDVTGTILAGLGLSFKNSGTNQSGAEESKLDDHP